MSRKVRTVPVQLAVGSKSRFTIVDLDSGLLNGIHLQRDDKMVHAQKAYYVLFTGLSSEDDIKIQNLMKGRKTWHY